MPISQSGVLLYNHDISRETALSMCSQHAVVAIFYRYGITYTARRAQCRDITKTENNVSHQTVMKQISFPENYKFGKPPGTRYISKKAIK